MSPAKTERTRRVEVQPYGGSYFLPGKIAGKAVTFLLDSGCTTNLLSCQLFDTLSARDKALLEPYGSNGSGPQSNSRHSTVSPILDPNPAREYILDTDASDYNLGTLLSQV